MGASAEQRVMEAIRAHFLDYGDAPSWTEIHLATGVHRQDMSRLLRRLAARGLITLRPGPRGIALVDRGAMLSDREIELTVQTRGAAVTWNGAVVTVLARAFPTPTDCDLPIDALLGQIDAAAAGEARHGEATEEGTEAGHAGEAAPAP